MTILNGNIPKYLEKVANKKDIICHLGNLSSTRKWMLENEEFKNKKAPNSSMQIEEDSNWSGAYSYDDYLNLLDNGDIDVMQKIKVATNKKVAELGKKYEEELISYQFDVVGDFFDVGLVLSGVPEAWLKPEYEKVGKPTVELIINGTFDSTVNKNIVIEGASRILAMVKILEDHDVLVNIKLVSAIEKWNTSNTNQNLFVIADVKDYDEPINYKKCSALLSPTFLRRGVFKVMETRDVKHKDSYGLVLPFDAIQINDKKQIDDLEKKLFKKDK